MQFFGTCLHSPALWHLNRHSVAGAFFIGILCAFIPLPFQMVIAAALAVFFRVNIPISVALVWITNPLTMPPIFYFTHEFGEWMLGMPDDEGFHFEANWAWFSDQLSNNWEPFLLGSLVCGLIFGALAYVTVHIAWRVYVSYVWRHRRSNSIQM